MAGKVAWEKEAETVDAGDDVPGTPGNPTTFSSLAVLTEKLGWITPTNLSVRSQSSRYGVAQDSSSQFHVWTIHD
jgi:hypothetical protein